MKSFVMSTFVMAESISSLPFSGESRDDEAARSGLSAFVMH